jgi:hypothetical protein
MRASIAAPTQRPTIENFSFTRQDRAGAAATVTKSPEHPGRGCEQGQTAGNAPVGVGVEPSRDGQKHAQDSEAQDGRRCHGSGQPDQP